MLVELTPKEIEWCNSKGLERDSNNPFNNNEDHRFNKAQPGESINRMGVVGEYVVQRELGLDVQIATDKPDRRGDIELFTGEWIEIKTGSKPHYRFGIEGLDIDSLFPQKFGVLVVPRREDQWGKLRIVGWCSNDYFRRNATKVQMRNVTWCLEQDQLAPFERFQLYLELAQKIEDSI